MLNYSYLALTTKDVRASIAGLVSGDLTKV